MKSAGVHTRRERKRIRFLVLVTLVAILFAVLIDLSCAWVLPLWITRSWYLLYAICGSAVLLLFVLRKRELRRMLLLGIFVVAMVVLYKIPWSTRKPFLRALSRVRIGMTVEEVDRVMSAYIKGSGIEPGGRFGSDENGQLELNDAIIFRQ